MVFGVEIDGKARAYLRDITEIREIVNDTLGGRDIGCPTAPAVAGPLAARSQVLTQHTVVTITWGAWKASHPETTILAEELALGRDSDVRNTSDAEGPIFPIGDVDLVWPSKTTSSA